MIRNDEVVGSIPTSSTIFNLVFSTTYSLAKNFVPFLYRRLTEMQSLSTITPLLMEVFVYAATAEKHRN